VAAYGAFATLASPLRRVIPPSGDHPSPIAAIRAVDVAHLGATDVLGLVATDLGDARRSTTITPSAIDASARSSTSLVRDAGRFPTRARGVPHASIGNSAIVDSRV
jgi:hypothetical protein